MADHEPSRSDPDAILDLWADDLGDALALAWCCNGSASSAATFGTVASAGSTISTGGSASSIGTAGSRC